MFELHQTLEPVVFAESYFCQGGLAYFITKMGDTENTFQATGWAAMERKQNSSLNPF